MKISEVIYWLERKKEELGDVNVCVYNKCHEMPCESFLFMVKNNELYVTSCEDDIVVGDFLMIE